MSSSCTPYALTREAVARYLSKSWNSLVLLSTSSRGRAAGSPQAFSRWLRRSRSQYWRKLGLQLDDADFTDHQAIASIARITGGNFRLLHRLFVQIERILKIKELSLVTDDVVEAARSTLVIGAT